MLGVYNHMTTALLLTGFFAYATKWGLNVAGLGVDVRHPSEMAHYAGTAWHGFLAISADYHMSATKRAIYFMFMGPLWACRWHQFFLFIQVLVWREHFHHC